MNNTAKTKKGWGKVPSEETNEAMMLKEKKKPLSYLKLVPDKS